MTAFLALRQAVVDAVEPAIPAVTTCKAHGGRFQPGEVKRIAVRAPAVLVALVSASEAKPVAGGVCTELDFGAFVVTRDRPGSQRDAEGIVISQALLALVASNRWGREDTENPTRIRARNLYSSKVDKQGIAIWAVTWRQAIEHGRLDPAELEDFTKLFADWDLAPSDEQIDASDEVALEQA